MLKYRNLMTGKSSQVKKDEQELVSCHFMHVIFLFVAGEVVTQCSP